MLHISTTALEKGLQELWTEAWDFFSLIERTDEEFFEFLWYD